MEVVERQILQLLSGNDVATVNAVLMEFAESPSSWNTCVELLSSQHLSVQFFTATILHSKIKKHWNQLGLEEKAQLFAILKTILIRLNNSIATIPRAYWDRISSSLLCASLQMPDGLMNFIQTAFEYLSTEFNVIGIDMLIIVPNEAESLDMSHVRQLEVKQQLGSLLAKIVELSEFSIAQQPSSIDIINKILRLLRMWARYGLSLGVLGGKPILKELLSFALRSKNEQLVQEACQFITESLDVVEAQETPIAARSSTLEFILQSITSNFECLKYFFEGDLTETANALTNCIAALYTKEFQYLISSANPNVDIFMVTLFCAAAKPRSLGCILFDVWPLVDDVPFAHRHPFIKERLFQTLFNIVIDQLTFPAEYPQWGSIEDKEDFEQFRSVELNGLDDVIIIILASIGHTFFSILAERLSSISAGGPEAIAANWRVIEAVCFILSCVSSDIKEEYHGDIQVHQFISSLIECALAIQPPVVRNIEPLRASTSKLVGSFTFLLVRADFICSAHYTSAIEYLFEGVFSSNEVVARMASKSLISLCTYGSDMLQSTLGTPRDLYNLLVETTATRIISQPLNLRDSSIGFSVIKGVCQSVSALSPNRASVFLQRLGNAVIEGLQHELHMTPPSPSAPSAVSGASAPIRIEMVIHLLQCGNYIIRFSDSSSGESAKPTLLGNYLNSMWQLVDAIVSSALAQISPTTPSIMKCAFDFYSYLSYFVGPSLFGQFEHINRIIVVCIANSICAHIAISCSCDLIEILCSYDITQEGIAQQITQLFNASLDAFVSSSARSDPDVIDSLFRLTSSIMIRCPQIIAENSRLDSMIEAILFILQHYHDDCIRSVLYTLQHLYFRSEKKSFEIHLQLLGFVKKSSSMIVDVLFGAITGQTISKHKGTCIECLLYIIISYNEVGQVEDCLQWFRLALLKHSTLPPEDTEAILAVSFRLAASNKRRFRSLITDISKISCGEQTVDCLGGYFDPSE